MRVTARARRSQGWWAVDVQEIPGLDTRAKRLDQVGPLVRTAAERLGLGWVDVDVVPELTQATLDEIRASKEATSKAAVFQKESAVRARSAARHLRDQGFTVRDVATVLEVSPQRVSQLVPNDSRVT